MNEKFALFSLDYPPERGGVARYLGDLVETAAGALDPYVSETHALTGPGPVRVLRAFATGPYPWRLLIGSLRSLRKRHYQSLLVSHVLPVGTAALLARWLGGLPYGVLIHGLDLRLAVVKPRRRWLARLVLRHACAVFVNSQAVAAEVRALDPRLDPVVVTPGVQPRTFPDRMKARAQLNIVPEAFICLTVARLVPRKGIDTMIALLATLPGTVRYVVIGDGADRERLVRLAHEAGVTDRVTFIHDADDTTRDSWFAAADLFVFLAREEPNDLEGFGLACLEAAVAGLPVLASRSGGVPEAVLDQQTGILVDLDEKNSLNEGFFELFQDPDRRIRLGRQGRERALRDFRWQDRWELIRERLSRV